MDTGCVMVWTTVASTAEGERVASILVEERLAACVNVLGEMQSFYRWKGSVEMGRERQLVIKTTAARVPALMARLGELHEYDLPELIVVPVAGGSDAYLNWIRESTAE